MTEPCDLSAATARRLMGAKALSPVELLESCLARIEATNTALNAIVAMDADAAGTAARRAEKEIMAGQPLGLLHGLPFGIKDLNATAGLRTTWGSLLFENTVPETDDSVVANLRNAGAIILAKTNTPEFGAGANTWNRVYGATGNPFDPEKTSGGSSGGSAAALAARMVPLANGSDYGGSLRTPAAFCGVTGYRPSPGVVPALGRPASLLPFSVQGAMGRSVEDTYLQFRAQVDFDIRDPFSHAGHRRLPPRIGGADLSTLKVAFSTDLGCAPMDDGIRQSFAERIASFRHVFGECDERDPDLGAAHEVFEIMRGLNFVTAHRERLENHRDLLGPNVIDNTERGMAFSLPDVAWAMKEQTRIYQGFVDFFEDVDVLICPAAAVSPFPHSELYPATVGGEAMPTYMRWLAITYALTTALPAVCCLPCGLDHMGMPFGLQVVGPNGSDLRVLEVAASLEHILAGNSSTACPVFDPALLAS